MDAFYQLDRELEEQADLVRYFHRSTRYSLLKDWWALQRRLKRASTRTQRQEAIGEIQAMRDNHGPLLKEALTLWDRAQTYRHAVRLMQQTRPMRPGEMNDFWEVTVLHSTEFAH